jgi:hypothetical protein
LPTLGVSFLFKVLFNPGKDTPFVFLKQIDSTHKYLHHLGGEDQAGGEADIRAWVADRDGLSIGRGEVQTESGKKGLA